MIMADILKVAMENLTLLEKIVKPTFGPHGIDAALKTYTGNIFATNSGHQIFNSVSLSHPIGRMICEQINHHLGLTGDGAKQMVILLAGILRSIYHNMQTSTKIEVSAKNSGLAQAFGYLRSKLIPKIREHLLSYRHVQSITFENRENNRNCIKSILQTTLNGKFSKEIIRVLVDRTIDLIFNNREQEGCFLNCLNQMIDQFKNICVVVSGMSLPNSKVVAGFLIKNNTLCPIDPEKLCKPTNFVIIKDKLDIVDIKFGAVRFEFNHFQLDTLVTNRVKIFERIADVLNRNSIYLVLCNHDIPAYAKSIFQKKRLHVIQHLDNDDTERIANYFKIAPLETIDEIFETDLSHYVGVLSGLNEMVIGRESYLRLCPSEEYKSDYPSCQLILCSPHESIGQQFYSAVFNMLKVIKMCCHEEYGTEYNESFCSIKYLPSAGCPEICVAEFLIAKATEEPDENLRTVYIALTDSLMKIPQIIHENSKQGNSGRFIEKIRMMKDLKTRSNQDGCISLGINSENGDVFEPIKHEIIEPFASKMLLLSHVLQIAQQILRIDRILPVKRVANFEK